MPRLNAEKRRESLIAAATAVFARLGYASATTAQIAAAANVSEPILYRHFESKQELFAAVLAEASAAVLSQLQAAAAGGKITSNRLKTVVALLADRIRRGGDEMRLLHGALAAPHGASSVAIVRRHFTRLHAFIRSLTRYADAKRAAWRTVITAVGAAALSSNLEIIDRATILDALDHSI